MKPVDQQQRRGAMTQLDATFMLEAGAGTGKTSILVERFVNCLRSGAELTSVAAITFTDKAAGELRERITRRLQELLSGSKPDEESPLLPEERKIVQDALDAIDTVVVSTIHSFAARLLRERPVEAGIDPAFGQLDALGSELMLARLWRDWLDELAAAQESAGARALSAALEAGVALSAVQKAAVEHFSRRHSLELSGARGAASDDGAAAAVRRDVAALKDLVPALRAEAQTCKKPDDPLCVGLDGLAGALEQLPSFGDVNELGWALVALAARRSAFGRKGAGGAPNWPQGKDVALVARDDALDAVQEAAGRFKERLARLVSCASAEFSLFAERRQRQAGLLDFDDLLGMTRDMLKGAGRSAADGARVRRYFQDRFSRLLVDEFQDTDPLQVEIVFLLCADDPADDDWQTLRLKPGKLFLVGDPKQSIYRFRDADITTFKRVKDRIDEQGGRVVPILQNFRTLPGIVDWVNAAFRPIMGDEETELRPAYADIVAGREDATAGEKVLVLAAGHGLAEPSIGEVRQAEADAVVGLLSGLESRGWTVRDPATKQDRPARLGDVTVLFKTYAAIGVYEDALRESGLPYRVEGGRSYFQRPEIHDVVSALRAVDVPGDALAVYAALHSSLFGFSDDELYAFFAAGGRFDPYADVPEGFEQFGVALGLLRDLHADRMTQSIKSVVDRLVRDTRLLEVLAADGAGAQAEGNLGKLLQLAEAFSEEDGATFHAYVRKLVELQSRADEGESPVGEAGQFVRLMSIHKAKGLEFPIVVLADTCGQPRGVFYNDVFVDRDDRRLLFGFEAQPHDGSTGAARCALPGDAALRAREADAHAFESLRLLYVAATRAGDRLIVPLVEGYKPPKGSFMAELRPHLTGGLGGGSAFACTLEVTPPDAPSSRAPATLSRGLIAARDEWMRLRAAALARAGQADLITSPSRLELLDRPDTDTATDVGEWVPNPQALALGDLVHGIMEAVPLDDVGALSAIADAASGLAGVPHLAARATELATACWHSGPVRSAAAVRHWRELPVSVVLDEVLLEGYADLVYETAGGYVVVDYKTDRDADLTAAVRRYELQLGAYAVALEAATGAQVGEAWVVMAAGGTAHTPAPAARILVDDDLRSRVWRAAEDAARAGRPLVETLSR